MVPTFIPSTYFNSEANSLQCQPCCHYNLSWKREAINRKSGVAFCRLLIFLVLSAVCVHSFSIYLVSLVILVTIWKLEFWAKSRLCKCFIRQEMKGMQHRCNVFWLIDTEFKENCLGVTVETQIGNFNLVLKVMTGTGTISRSSHEQMTFAYKISG